MTEGADGSRSQVERGPDPTPDVRSAVAGGRRSVAAAGDLGIALSGDRNHVVVQGDVLVGARPRGRHRSGYLLEVREMRAPRFEGRADELAAMVAFATAPEGEAGGYWRWLAPAWTGKTALMAEFVLNPPDSVDVLAFFITARMAGRADRTAFLDALGEQLREYLREGDVESATQGAFLDGLERAAAQARAAGRRVVLVVDGLDEDTGVRTGSSGHSIAALLPRTPPPGLRIIVAGRPNPPVPSDVPRGHPLRDPGIDHPLATSPVALAMREDAERSLEAMLDAGGLGRELVALTAAAGGGLSAADLAELTGDSRRRVELALSGVIGRSFQRRPAQWATDADGRPLSLYSFAHQELSDGARDILGPAALAEQRARVHAYVATAREAGWPPETSEYALAGYPQLLRETRDTGRLEALALDQARHERLWQTTGTDSQALTEIADAVRLHRAVEDPDVAACVRLAYRRDRVWEKATSVPGGVILAWAKSGQVRRALAAARHRKEESELPTLLAGIAAKAGADTDVVAQVIATAQSIGEPDTRVKALVGVAVALATDGPSDVASDLVQEADEVMRAVADPAVRARLTDHLIQGLYAVGRKDTAAVLVEQVVEQSNAVSNPGRRDWELVDLASTLATLGRQAPDARLSQRALAVAESLADPLHQARALGHVATHLALAGHHDEAIRLIERAIRIHPHHTSWRHDGTVLIAVVRVMAAVGRYEDAVATADAAANPDLRPVAHRLIAQIMANAGRYADALQLAHSIADPWWCTEALAGVALAHATAGDRQGATETAQQALDIARIRHDTHEHASVLATVAQHLVSTGRRSRAESLARQASDIALAQQRVDALTAAATAWLAIGQREPATDLVQRALEQSHRAATYRDRETSLASVVEVLVRAEQYEKAADTAHTVTDRHTQVDALANVAEGLTAAGRPDEASPLLRRAVELRDDDGQAADGLLRAHLADERFEEAIDLVRSIHFPEETALRLAEVARSMAVHGHSAGATRLITQALDAVRYIDEPDFAARAHPTVVAALIANAQPEDALRLARSLTGYPAERARALASVAAGYGPTPQGRTLLAEALAISDPLAMVAEIAMVEPAALESLADYLQADIAADLAQPGHPTQPPPTQPLPQAE
ncbi:tetratricopeptide repeat protein [Streptomyces sp. 71268]|uniref:tetratricopeptide repeat protein n=1 Tax=Streptomyces sp. 71268 TaxID=3002640 RepID=UPI0023F90DE9|nr:tetratricopeptide repeat protein [Streptomyces sp. 71268]WEV26721.1 tetratricopeptide repeat protein [Streptomyces sp. 71268]